MKAASWTVVFMLLNTTAFAITPWYVGQVTSSSFWTIGASQDCRKTTMMDPHTTTGTLNPFVGERLSILMHPNSPNYAYWLAQNWNSNEFNLNDRCINNNLIESACSYWYWASNLLSSGGLDYFGVFEYSPSDLPPGGNYQCVEQQQGITTGGPLVSWSSAFYFDNIYGYTIASSTNPGSYIQYVCDGNTATVTVTANPIQGRYLTNFLLREPQSGGATLASIPNVGNVMQPLVLVTPFPVSDTLQAVAIDNAGILAVIGIRCYS